MNRLATVLLMLGLLAGSLGASSSALYGNTSDDAHSSRRDGQERFLYVATIAQSASDPDSNATHSVTIRHWTGPGCRANHRKNLAH